MSNCFITLDPISEKNRNALMKDSAATSFYGSRSASAQLNFTRSELFVAGKRYTEGMSISGVQQKMSLKIEGGRLIPTSKGGEFIIKPTPDGLPQCAEMEHVSMLISRLYGIETAQCGLVSFSDGERAYITKRYDRQGGSKLHQEDMCSVMNQSKRDKYGSTFEEVGHAIARATNNKVLVLVDFLKRCLLSYLVSNDDLHMKNLSLIRNQNNKSLTYDGMTPNYDVLCTHFYSTSALDVLGMPLMNDREDGVYSTEAYSVYGYYTKTDFLALANSLGIPEKIATKVIESFGGKESEVDNLIDRSYLSDEYKEKFKEVIRGRRRAILAPYPL